MADEQKSDSFLPGFFTVGSGSVVKIKGKTYHCTTPHAKTGYWNTKEGKVIDVAGASQDDSLDSATYGGEEVYERESNKAIVGRINKIVKKLSKAPEEKK